MRITNFLTAGLVPFCLLCLIGCDGSVDTTDDATHIEADIPKVEVGDEAVDLNPATDGDVDIDTPLPGDS